MSNEQINALLVLAGSFCLSNGLLLLLSPDRFATLRQSDKLPKRYNAVLQRLTAHHSTGRSIGAAAIATGVALLALAMRRTEPASKR